MKVSSEVFPVDIDVLPALHAYRVDTGQAPTYTAGGKLSYRLRKRFSGHWAWTSGRIITDAPVSRNQIDELVEEAWKEESESFGSLRGVHSDPGWSPHPSALAGFVARGLAPDLAQEARSVLRGNTEDLGSARVERVHRIRGWEVDRNPALSISVSSHLLHKNNLSTFLGSLPARDALGLWVSAENSDLKGEVLELAGPLAEHRRRLVALTQDEEMEALLRQAPDDEPVVRVLSGRREYDYIASALRPIIRTEDFQRFGIDARRALDVMRLSPHDRLRMVLAVANLFKQRNLIGPRYGSSSHPRLFKIGMETPPALRFGGNHVRPYDERALLRNLRTHGLYRRAEQFRDEARLRVGLLSAVGGGLGDFLHALETELEGLGFHTEVAQRVDVNAPIRADLEGAVDDLQTYDPHILLGILPDEYGENEDESYHHFKSLTVGRGIPSQVVYKSTLSNRFALGNIALGLLGKTGNVPFVLAEPLPYADIVVGIDIARERKRHLPGSMNATAIARIYFSNGEFVRYVIHDSPLEGETIPERVLQALFPVAEFEGKRVVIHRDGYFRGREKRSLMAWAEQMGATFNLVEILKTGAPRLYGEVDGRTVQPPKGSAMLLSEDEVFLVSSLPPFKDATPQPLRIRSEPGLPVDHAIDSVLSLTLLHYGSLRPPRLPVTIHYSDKIAHMVLRGIKPKSLEGHIPFWL